MISLLKVLWAALLVWRKEREIHNTPEMIKNKLDEARQVARDRLNEANAVAANPNSTPAEHAEALRKIRLADS